MRKNIVFLVFIAFAMVGCEKKEKASAVENKTVVEQKVVEVKTEPAKIKYDIYFIELGSKNCAPCQAMVPVMEKVKENFEGLVRVVFYDVWLQSQKKYAEKYKIKIIPTQVFLDSEGNEFFRHEGFFAYEEIEKLLNEKLNS
ncbi:MAG: thioredoxin family protein [Spirochaetales bacterium]|nr:thioredoxin family protein [Spirochaetales bacterium]